MRCVNVNKLVRGDDTKEAPEAHHISDDPHELLIKQENNEDSRFIEVVSA